MAGHVVTLFGACALLTGGANAEEQDRRWLPPLVEEVTIEDRNGSLFGDPKGLRASPRGGFVLYDWAESSFREFSASGDLVWKAGRAGEGPGEFSRPLDYEFDADGNLLVVDEALIRLTVLSPDGAVISTQRVDDARQIFPTGFVPDGWAVMPNFGSDSVWASRGAARRSALVSPFANLAPITTEAWAANLKSGGAVVVYRWSSNMVWLDPDGSIRKITQAVESVSFPEAVYIAKRLPGGGSIQGTKVDPTAIPLNTNQPGVGLERIYVRPLGRTEDSRKIVDVYTIATGEYVGSHRLPHIVDSVVVLEDGRLATLEINLIPTVRIWRVE